MTHWLYYYGWQNVGVGNFTAGVVAGLLTTFAVKKWRLHEKARDWFHKPIRDRLDEHERHLRALRGLPDDE